MPNGLSAITKDFIIGLGQVVKGSGSKASSSGGGDAVRVSTGLRAGATLYARAIQNLNQIGSALNLSKDTLGKLGELVDDAIDLAKESTKISTQNSKRKKLNREFHELGDEFRKLLEDTKFQDKEILTREGLAEVFVLVGLDKDRATSIAKVLDQFITPKEDDFLASEEIKGLTPKLPAAVQPSTPTPTFVVDQISKDDGNFTVSAGFVSAVNNIYTDDDNEGGLNNTGFITEYIEAENGSLTTLGGAITVDITLKAVSEISGYSVIESVEDFLGFNGAGVNQLYLVDSTGAVVHQLTDFVNPSTIGSVDLSSDGTKVAVAADVDSLGTNADGSEEIFLVEVAGAFGVAPSVSEMTQVTSGSNAISMDEVYINEAGTEIAFRSTGGGFSGVRMYDIGSASFDATLQSDATITNLAGFYEEDKIAFNTNTDDVYISIFGQGNKDLLFNGGPGSVNHIASENGYMAFNTATSVQSYQASGGGGGDTVTHLTLGAGDTISKLSITDNTFGASVDIGIVGNLNSISGDSDTEFYRLRENISNTTSVLKKPDTYTKIFEGAIDTRSNAFRVLSDLTALRKQIDKNITGLDNALQVLQDNIDIVRTTGLVMLDFSDKLLSNEDAGKIASRVQQEIRNRANRRELAQAGNLSPIAAAALVSLDQDTDN